MKIKRIKFQNYTVFEDQQMEFSPGINVIIGENGTGKTHLMKALYSACQSADSVFWTLAGQVMSFKSYENEKTNKNRNSYDFCNCYTDVSLWKPICFSKSMCTKGNVMAEHGNSR